MIATAKRNLSHFTISSLDEVLLSQYLAATVSAGLAALTASQAQLVRCLPRSRRHETTASHSAMYSR